MVVTSYAQDTVIDNLFLPHQPRYDTFKNFLGVIQSRASDLLNNPISPAQILASNSTDNHTSVSAWVTSCTDQDPAHFGSLDPTQIWHFESSTLQNNASGRNLCVDASSSNPVKLLTCSQRDSERFYYDSRTRHIVSYLTFPCQAHGSATKRCHRCLDVASSSDSLSLWDCKDSASSQPQNQLFDVDSKHEGGVRFVGRSTSGGMCLTVKSELGNNRVELHKYGKTHFISSTSTVETLRVVVNDASYVLSPSSVIVADSNGTILVRTDHVAPPPPPHLPRVSKNTTNWEHFTEDLTQTLHVRTSRSPLEQLELTNGFDSDYLVYSTDLPHNASNDKIEITQRDPGGSFAYPFIQNGSLMILSVAMGLSNGGVSPNAAKGISNVTVGGVDVTHQVWTHKWILQGEQGIGVDTLPWTPVSIQSMQAAHTWFRAQFDRPGKHQSDVAYALDLSWMWKGQAYFNGFHLGRHYLLNGTCSGTCAPPIKNGHCYEHWHRCDQPTQMLYHVPSALVRDVGNLVVIFEETIAPAGVNRQVWRVELVRLIDHPY